MTSKTSPGISTGEDFLKMFSKRRPYLPSQGVWTCPLAWIEPTADLAYSTNKNHLAVVLIFLAGRVGFEPTAEFNPSTHLAGEPNRPLWHLPEYEVVASLRRRRWDSNPRWVAPNLFSRQAPSAARPPLLNYCSVRAVKFYHI